MARTRSAKGVIVDFDLLKIRQKLAAQPVTVSVKAREDFIDKKLRRRMRKVKNAAAAPINVDSGVLADIEVTETQPTIEPPKEEVKPVETKHKLRPPVKQ